MIKFAVSKRIPLLRHLQRAKHYSKMTKEQYFAKRLTLDFINHVLLKSPLYNDREVSDKLKSKINPDRLYQKLKQAIVSLAEKHFPTELIQDSNGKYLNKLPDGINLGMADRMVDEYKSMINNDKTVLTYLTTIIPLIERLTWTQGVDDMAHNLCRFKEELQKQATHLSYIELRDPEKYELQAKYKAAKHVTLGERLKRDNYKAIVDYFETLKKYAIELCGAELAMGLSRLYRDIELSDVINNLIDKYKSLHSQAADYRGNNILLKDETSEGWEDEHTAIYPLDFFDRNIESVTPSQAFQFLVFLKLSSSEEALKQEGYLNSKGKLLILTSPSFDSMESVSRFIKKYLL